jgi:hypothetical protein
VKRARELIYTAERQASRDVGLAGLRLKPGSSHHAGYYLLGHCLASGLIIAPL